MKEKTRRKIELLEIEKEKEILKLELAKEKELLQAKLDFFTNVAHEIRTPLTLIKAPLGKVIKLAGGVPGIENSLGIMERNTNRLIDLTGQLLDFRQIEMHKFHLSLERVEITKLVKDTYIGFTALAEEKNVTLSLSMFETSYFVLVDVDAFNKILYNLLSNAVKYAESRASISLLPHFKGSKTFTILVKNDGYLIPEQMSQKIFEPFFRIHEVKTQVGTGIGLALSRSLTELHGGVLMLEPSDDDMNTFSMTLPILHEGQFVADEIQKPINL
jgi:signal transduction histidine kinase